jgi:hypothetical protein
LTASGLCRGRSKRDEAEDSVSAVDFFRRTSKQRQKQKMVVFSVFKTNL